LLNDKTSYTKKLLLGIYIYMYIFLMTTARLEFLEIS